MYNDLPYDWEHIRDRVIRRDGRRCRNCGVNTALTVHHIMPRAQGGRYNAENLITLCTSCHDKAEIGDLAMFEIGGRGAIVNSGPRKKKSDAAEQNVQCSLCGKQYKVLTRAKIASVLCSGCTMKHHISDPIKLMTEIQQVSIRAGLGIKVRYQGHASGCSCKTCIGVSR